MNYAKSWVQVNIPQAGELPLSREGDIRVGLGWLLGALEKTDRPENYQDLDVLFSLNVRDLQLLFGDVTVETKTIEPEGF